MYDEVQYNALADFADRSDKLFDMGIIRSDSFTGEIGEFIASRLFGLQMTNRSTEGVDGTCSNGLKYQVKSTSGKLPTQIKVDITKFDFLVVIVFDRFYKLQKALKIASSKIEDGIFRFKNATEHIEQYETVELKVSKTELNAIDAFGKAYNKLIDGNLVNSKRIVGDVGEIYAAKYLNLRLNNNLSLKGFDALNERGQTFEIKTRRVYDSGRRNNGDSTRRLNGLVGKNADFLVVVTIDRAFKCSGMWVMPMANIINPKSANLKTVNNTVGVKSVVSSQIDYLKTSEPFTGFN